MLANNIFIAITVLISFLALNNSVLLNKLLLYPRAMNTPTEYYRLLTSGFVHADINHLLFNMFTLYFFGQSVNIILSEISGAPFLMYVLLYLSAIIVSSLPAFAKHKNDPYYRSLGASGGVSAIVFFSIYYFPWSKIQIMFIPIGIPALLYGILYTGYSYYMAKRGQDNVGHDAHLGGALYGFVFGFLVDPTHGASFLYQSTHPQF